MPTRPSPTTSPFERRAGSWATTAAKASLVTPEPALFNTEERRMIARARATLAWIDTLPEPERTWASFGIPEMEWPRYSAWVEAALVAVGAKGKGR